MPCRINKRRVWTARLSLELYSHYEACFVTLTYSDENLPPGNTVRKRDLQLFLKRLRKAHEPATLRFFGVGEYGERTGRAHYHVILYGLGPNDHAAINAAWALGNIHIGSVTRESCSYVAGYTTKKLTNPKDKRLLPGQEPEFALMSRNPGIGKKAADNLGSQLSRSSGGALWVAKNGDVPQTARIDQKMYPLGRYIVGKVRLAVGMENENSPSQKAEERKAELLAMREAHGTISYKTSKPYVDWNKSDGVVARQNARQKFKRTIL